MAKILKIALGTVSVITHNQLYHKFNLIDSNMKELMKRAIHTGASLSLPEALWHPSIIVLNRDLLNDVNLTDATF